MYDVLVVGAGPAGSHTAFCLARAGRRVAVLEAKASAGADICCTGIVSTECYQRFIAECGVDSRATPSAVIATSSNHSLRVAAELPPAYAIDRPALNEALARRAQQAGAEYFFQSRPVLVQSGADPCIVTAEVAGRNRQLRARAIVIAGGLACSLPRQMGLGAITHCAAGAQAEVQANVDEVQVLLDQDKAPGGFAWLVPTWNGKGLAGVVARDGARQRLLSWLDVLHARGRISGALPDVRCKPIPLRTLERTYGDRVVVVGEAAGQVKPTTFGGLYTGLLCAELAATTLHDALAAGDLSAKRLAGYEGAWKSRLGLELERGWRLRRLYDALGQRQIDRLMELVSADGLHEEALGWKEFSFDWHCALFVRVLRRPQLLRALLAPRTVPVLLSILSP